MEKRIIIFVGKNKRYEKNSIRMLDALGYRRLTSKDILSHTIGGLVAGIAAHWIYVLFVMLF